MEDLYRFVLMHKTTDLSLEFNNSMNALNTSSDFDSGKLGKTNIQDFVKMEDLKKFYVHRETKRLTKNSKDQDVGMIKRDSVLLENDNIMNDEAVLPLIQCNIIEHREDEFF